MVGAIPTLVGATSLTIVRAITADA